MKQRIGGYPIEAVTQEEVNETLKEQLGHHFSAAMRDWYRGIKPMRLPVITALASGAVTLMPGNASAGSTITVGPEQGYVWRIDRVLIASTAGGDNGLVVIYGGSDPTNVSSTFDDPTHILDVGTVNKAFYPKTILRPGEQLYAYVTTVAGHTYTMVGDAVEAPAEMVAKIIP